jgi:hypothetical protein
VALEGNKVVHPAQRRPTTTSDAPGCRNIYKRPGVPVSQPMMVGYRDTELASVLWLVRQS